MLSKCAALGRRSHCLKVSCYVLTALSQLSLTSHSELPLYMLMQASPSNGCTVARTSSLTCTAAVRDFYSTLAKAFSNSGCYAEVHSAAYLGLQFAECLQYLKSYLTALLRVELAAVDIVPSHCCRKIYTVFCLGDNVLIAICRII